MSSVVRLNVAAPLAVILQYVVHFMIFLEVICSKQNLSRGLYYKTFYGHNLQIFIIS
jgi:hypothetical protein